MTDRAVQNALAQRTALAAELIDLEVRREAIQQEIKAAEDFIRAWHAFAGLPLGDALSPPPPPPPPSAEVAEDAGPKRSRREAAKLNPDRASVVEAVREMILAKGQPVPTEYLMAGLQERGMRIHGTDPRGVFNTMMWRSQDAVVRLDKFGFWLAERPWPEAAYTP